MTTEVRRDRIAGVVIIAVAVFGWLQTAGIPAEPRFFPRALLVLMGALALVMLSRSFFSKEKPANDDVGCVPIFEDPRAWLKTATLTLGFIWLVTQIGFFSASVLFILTFALTAGYRRPGMIATTIIVFIGFIYGIFVVLLHRPLPRELLFDLFS